MSPLTASAHACALYKGQVVDVDVVKKPDECSSHIAIVIHADGGSASAHTVDVVTDDANLDEALSTGVKIAHEVIDSGEGGARPPRLPAPAFKRREVRVESQAFAAPGGF